MESLSRPPHRRKHSAATNASSSSLKNPYDDVLFSGGGRVKFGAHEYAEIFSGSSSSSIPVLELSGPDDRAGSGGVRSSKLDYSSIFGGLGNDDVAMAYEELFNGAQTKAGTQLPADAQSPYQESGSPHSSEKAKKSSGGDSDQSIGETKKHLSMSFNKTGQRNIDASSGETHITQLHAVPGFTHFVDGTPRRAKAEGEKHNISSLKRDVSRTWSFSAGAEEVTVKGELNSEKSLVPDKSPDSNETKLKSHISKLPSFASDKTAGEYLPPLFDEELNENSVAAESAAALKKAIEQAQESIRIAKMIMERKKEGFRDGSLPRSKGRVRKDKKKTGIDREVDHEAERVRENVGAAKEHRNAMTEKEELENVGKKVEANDSSKKETNFTGLVADAGCETAKLKSEKVDIDNLKCSINKLVSHLTEMKPGLEQCQSTVGQTEPENVAEPLERVVNCSPSTQEKENIMSKVGENFRISEKDEVIEERSSAADDKRNCGKKFVEWKDNGEEKIGMIQKDVNVWFDSEQQLKEPMGEQISEMEPEIIREIGKKLKEVHEQEIDEKKLNCGHEGDGHKLREEYEQSEIAKTMEANNSAEMQKHDISQDAEETNDAVEENEDKFAFQEAAYEKDKDEAVGAHSNDSGVSDNDSGVSDTHSNDVSTIFSETREYYDVDLSNNAEEYQAEGKDYKEDDSLPGVSETFSDQEVNELSGTDSLRRCASEANFIRSRLNDDFEVTYKAASEANNAAEEYAANIDMQNFTEVHSSNIEAAEFDRPNVMEGNLDNNEQCVSTHESPKCAENAKDNNTSSEEELKGDIDMTSDEREFHEPKEMDKSETDQNLEKNKEDLTEQKDPKENDQKFETDDQQQRIEAIKRGREREKDRIAVERAIREARERAFAEARERAERAAVERATAEARQRVMSEAWAKPADKASIEAKIRAERAAVERATEEARKRALEKARSQKTSTESRSSGLKHSFSSSDLEKFDGTTSESAQRRKARLERHQRIMERAAKALAEKNMRDFLAQKEQAERNRLAESLDADIKRWSSGKEGNLRALLSTLQYILGPDSGWQPISLTEIITTAAVKKAYRKATLCVHPDKLQQRRATIQQKYICEKVFDLLKAAWNRFNSEER